MERTLFLQRRIFSFIFVKNVKVRRCGKSYKVFPKRGFSNVIEIVKGTTELLHKQLYKQQIFLRRDKRGRRMG